MAYEVPEKRTVYKHYKGGLYYVIDIAQQTETGEALVVYRGGKTTWARPLSMWIEDVEYEGKVVKRFTKL